MIHFLSAHNLHKISENTRVPHLLKVAPGKFRIWEDLVIHLMRLSRNAESC